MRYIILLLTIFILQVHAERFLYESEPNNTPKEGITLHAPETIMGNMQDKDQDMFIWEISDADADYYWDIELHGLPDKMTRMDVMDIEFNENGDVTKVNTIFSLISPDGLVPLKKTNLVLNPGRLYFGLSYSGNDKNRAETLHLKNDALKNLGFDFVQEDEQIDRIQAEKQDFYQIRLVKGKKIYQAKTDNNTKKNPLNLRPDFRNGVYFSSGPLWLELNIDEKKANQVWQLHGTIQLDRKLTVKLYDTTGAVVATKTSDTFGYFELLDLKLSSGKYLLELQSKEDSIATIEFVSTGEYISGSEAEPNNSVSTSNRIDMETVVTGRLSDKKDADFYQLDITSNNAGKRLNITLGNIQSNKVQLCLLESNNNRLKCEDSKTNITMANLLLDEGSYRISVSRAAEQTPYELKVSSTGRTNPIIEAEPNDDFVHAASMNEKRVIKGEAVGTEYDFFKFYANDESRLWTIQAVGENLDKITLYNSKGKNIQEFGNSGKSKRLKLSHLKLHPGEHVISIKGTNSKYLLRAFPSVAIDEALETEPNDTENQSQAISLGQIRKGLLQNKTDVDIYRFRLRGEQGIQMKLKPPADGKLQYYLTKNGIRVARKLSLPGQELEFKALLSPGDYQLRLTAGNQPSDNLYSVELNTFDALTCTTDCEPNDDARHANMLGQTTRLSGQANTHDDYDWYQLPAVDSDRLIILRDRNESGITNFNAFIDYDKSVSVKRDSEKHQVSFQIASGKEAYIRLGGSESYDFDILIDNKNIPEPQVYQGLRMSVTELAEGVKAFISQAQILKGFLDVDNFGDLPQRIILSSKSSDYSWRVSMPEHSFELGPGQSKKIPIEIYVPANVTHEQQTSLAFLASIEGRISAHTSVSVKSSIQFHAQNPQPYAELDEKLSGGVNVASAAMGGQRTAEDIVMNTSSIGNGFDNLFDGYTALGVAMQYRGGRKTDKDFVTIKLGGPEFIDVQGIILNPLSQKNTDFYLKNFEFQLSQDGVQFETVLKDQLQPVDTEQSFVLDNSMKAKYARLIMLGSQDGKINSPMSLGEWKVIANPTQLISGQQGFNLADPAAGGFVTWAKPEISGDWDISLLTEKIEKRYQRSRNNQPWQWAIGFHNQRAAKIERIQWLPVSQDITSRKNFEQIKHVKIFVSTESNVGPWNYVTEADINPELKVQDILLPHSPWARYVKFTTNSISVGHNAYFPETIRIFEVKADTNYQSILGEWGELSQTAIYEKLNPVENITTIDSRGNHNKQAAFDLTDLVTASGQVQLEQANKPDWFKYTTQQNDNTLVVSLSGNQTVNTVVHIEDEQGNIPPLLETHKEINSIQYKYAVVGGMNYYAKVEEPPRSVIFVWDTSGSTQSYESIIYQALYSYSNDVIPDRDTVNFLPFGGELLMDQWYGDSFYLKSILNNYARKDDSSSAEKAILQASNALADRQGSKAIIVITDAITNRTSEMWESLKQVHPRIFALGIVGVAGFGGNIDRQIDLMQSWSRVNNGEFIKVVTHADVEQAFARAAAKLRSPAAYKISMNSEFVKLPGPGWLQIKGKNENASGAVELILDASGSMLKKMDGKRRIGIAKEVLVTAVSDIIPAGTPVALRVFGDKQANACRTDLAMHLQPLQPEKAVKVISAIQAKNLAKTPIADSLSKVASDLKSHQGKKVVILVTDGEETCEGNPQEVIEKLIDDGLDIRLNIVGFAIDDKNLKQQFRLWSGQGGGKYFDSSNSESLRQSVKEALKIPYSVYDSGGELFKEGTVNGNKLELPAGSYTIKVFGEEIKTFENYRIEGEALQTIEM